MSKSDDEDKKNVPIAPEDMYEESPFGEKANIKHYSDITHNTLSKTLNQTEYKSLTDEQLKALDLEYIKKREEAEARIEKGKHNYYPFTDIKFDTAATAKEIEERQKLGQPIDFVKLSPFEPRDRDDTTQPLQSDSISSTIKAPIQQVISTSQENLPKTVKIDSSTSILEAIKKFRDFLWEKICKIFSKLKPKTNTKNQNTSIAPTPNNKTESFLDKDPESLIHTKPQLNQSNKNQTKSPNPSPHKWTKQVQQRTSKSPSQNKREL
ncbi:hypothetical protein phytr_2250 [Candidatus Phycorickettsia trachydisci]|uniref:Uncharacterized protein n=1 Tax=Candidatus Phycorickettsia trachydisci TaxID=2115978 RepID=A0A2P1P7E0_9RICK|nr:hypothetical protein [Candidatus Phycorickettsia trachydisci]AVP87183.1 hypothetical protein phytr_2250 [Candidatus Phycorickettsia trachydisci]